MSGLIHPVPLEAKASAKTPKHKETAGACRERASADLLRSMTMFTANERMILERSAASWTERALLLDRVEGTAKPGTGPSSDGVEA